MYGAILGDIIGSPYEFDRGDKTKDFALFDNRCSFTDDSVMTVAVAQALMNAGIDADVESIKQEVVLSMQRWGKRYPYAGYGSSFRRWLLEWHPRPYGSYGNGSAMRVSAAGWLYDSLERTREVARATAEVTHNHVEGIKGAESTAAIIYLSRTGASKDQIKEYVVREFGYDLSRTVDEIRPTYHHVESCQETVPEAITCFLEGKDFEDVIRNAVSLGGDTDTLGAIAGAMAEAFFGIPAILKAEVKLRVDECMIEVLNNFDKIVSEIEDTDDWSLKYSALIENAIEHLYSKDDDKDASNMVFASLMETMANDGAVLVPYNSNAPMISEEQLKTLQIGDTLSLEQEVRLKVDVLKDNQEKQWLPVFTNEEEQRKEISGNVIMNQPLYNMMQMALDMTGVEGMVINPFGKYIQLNKQILETLVGAMKEWRSSHGKNN